MTFREGNPGIEELLDFAKDTIASAGEKALELYGKGNPGVKFDEELVTSAELVLMNFFRDRLNRIFPGHGVFGDPLPAEDYVHGERRYLWIFDPMDGVANFQAGIPIWSISLALSGKFLAGFRGYLHACDRGHLLRGRRTEGIPGPKGNQDSGHG